MESSPVETGVDDSNKIAEAGGFLNEVNTQNQNDGVVSGNQENNISSGNKNQSELEMITKDSSILPNKNPRQAIDTNPSQEPQACNEDFQNPKDGVKFENPSATIVLDEVEDLIDQNTLVIARTVENNFNSDGDIASQICEIDKPRSVDVNNSQKLSPVEETSNLQTDQSPNTAETSTSMFQDVSPQISSVVENPNQLKIPKAATSDSESTSNISSLTDLDSLSEVDFLRKKVEDLTKRLHRSQEQTEALLEEKQKWLSNKAALPQQKAAPPPRPPPPSKQKTNISSDTAALVVKFAQVGHLSVLLRVHIHMFIQQVLKSFYMYSLFHCFCSKS